MIRLTRFLAAAAVAALPVAAAAEGPSTMTDPQREAFRAEVRAYLLDNPEVIMEALDVLKERREQAERAADGDLVARNAEALYEDPHSWSNMAAGEGDITIVEFLDYRCGYCKRAHPVVAQLLEERPDVRLVIKEFPILGPDSLTAGRMAMAALEIDAAKYRELNDALMSHKGQLSEAAAYRIANDAGYDIAELKALAASEEISARVEANYALAEALRISGTPSFVMGDEILRGFVPLSDMLAIVDRQVGASN